jgi:hypothetical protein
MFNSPFIYLLCPLPCPEQELMRIKFVYMINQLNTREEKMGNLISRMMGREYRVQSTEYRRRIRSKRPLLFRFRLAAVTLTVGVCLFGLNLAQAEDNVFTENVGIGTSTPTSKLEVQGEVTVGVDEGGYDVKFYGSTSGKYLIWDKSQTALLVEGGKVGIGTIGYRGQS